MDGKTKPPSRFFRRQHFAGRLKIYLPLDRFISFISHHAASLTETIPKIV